MSTTRVQVMGVVNVTDDSFSDGGHYLDADRAVEHGLALVADGASIVDVGGESTRPGAVAVTDEEELRRVLPVIEALACGAAVVASDIPAMREAGGPAAVYAPVGDVGAWSHAVAKLLADPASAPPRCDRLAWAGRFTWTAHAETIARAYHRLLGRRNDPTTK